MTKPLIAFQPSFDIRASDFFRHWSLVIGHSTGHGPTARQKRKEAVSTNLPGNRIAAWLWKAALKTHALQTLGDGRVSEPREASGVRPIYRRFQSGYRDPSEAFAASWLLTGNAPWPQDATTLSGR